MYNSRHSKEYHELKRFDKVYKYKPTDCYTCSTYDLDIKAFKNVCSQHFIRTVVIRELTLDAIRCISGYVRENEAEFIEKIRTASTVRQEEAAKAHKKQLSKNERRIVELDNLFRKVYEDNANGKLSDERFEQLSGAYETEQQGLKTQNAELKTELDAFNTDSIKADNFIDIVRRYTDFDELTTPMLNEFIEKILVHEADKSTGERIQELDIYFNFIGNFTVPTEEIIPTAEELAEQEKQREKRAKQREANRRCYANKRAEMERKRAEDAGEIPPPTQEEIELAEAERLAQKQKRAEEERVYKREWARRDREKKRAEKAAISSVPAEKKESA
jgi:hypothetical protein